MSRSPFAYPLVRGVDGDSGGAADLQTDVMRFMAILALCLVAIFALVQSLPMAPQPTPAQLPEPLAEVKEPPPVAETPRAPPPEPKPSAPEAASVIAEPPKPVARAPAPIVVDEPVELTRPKWVPQYTPADAPPKTTQSPPPVAVADPEPEGFTLRFESDLALTRLVAVGKVGFYAIDSGRAQRMSVAESRISFWNASTPQAFHEMEAGTVPGVVVDALSRTGADPRGVQWGVTLPGRMSTQLDTLMRQHRGGSLVIHASGDLKLEAGS